MCANVGSSVPRRVSNTQDFLILMLCTNTAGMLAVGLYIHAFNVHYARKNSQSLKNSCIDEFPVGSNFTHPDNNTWMKIYCPRNQLIEKISIKNHGDEQSP